jgi:hypothetical protein
MAGEESFELSIEVLQAFEFTRFRVITILRGGAFGEVSSQTLYPSKTDLSNEVVRGKEQELH